MRTILGIAVTALVLAGCASGSVSHQGASDTPGATPVGLTASGGPSAAQNKAAAQAEADRLASHARVPSGASRLSVQPAGLVGPTMGSPASSQLIDTVDYYRVSMSLSQARVWFQAHSQPGLVDGGSSSSSDREGPTGYGFEFDPSPAPHWNWGSASLQIGLATEGTTSTAIRVDGVAQWINPTPTADTSRGRRMRVTILAGCPATDRGYTDVRNPAESVLAKALLPASAPSSGLKCLYSGINGEANTLRGSQHLSAAEAGGAAAHIRALPLGSWGDGIRNCPMEDGTVTILAFGYVGGSDVDIWQNTSGCTSTDNGRIITNGI